MNSCRNKNAGLSFSVAKLWKINIFISFTIFFFNIYFYFVVFVINLFVSLIVSFLHKMQKKKDATGRCNWFFSSMKFFYVATLYNWFSRLFFSNFCFFNILFFQCSVFWMLVVCFNNLCVHWRLMRAYIGMPCVLVQFCLNLLKSKLNLLLHRRLMHIP